MNRFFLLTISVIITLSFTTQVFANEGRVIEGKGSNFEYVDRMYKISHILRMVNGNLLSTSDELPRTTEEAHDLFEEVCAQKSSNQDLNKKLTVTNQGFLAIYSFECDKRLEEGSYEMTTVQFIISVDRDDNLKDLQINQLRTTSKARQIESHELTKKDSAEIGIAVAASTLVSGILVKQLYAGEHDKFLHATAGSLIASAATLLSYYGLDVTKNQAALIGFATSVAVALLKEYAYDASQRKVHTVDIRDARATALGGAVGTVFIRLKFDF